MLLTGRGLRPFSIYERKRNGRGRGRRTAWPGVMYRRTWRVVVVAVVMYCGGKTVLWKTLKIRDGVAGCIPPGSKKISFSFGGWSRRTGWLSKHSDYLIKNIYLCV